ncbi:MAG: ketoacyl-ACP synthase III [Chitinophaga sp.]|uniref:ketoacyl-ACP synthase III n=1 Tax=Chitinophaga sp. TaxID=1869181 RepID=UPI0025BA42FF|nr:ketoacyl-ACP synthase III [Chitinophaga sp.]MBV8254342.1 ketoacyl-ACP synthase III [Chitinophaga sp.]
MGTFIKRIAVYLPEKKITNEQLVGEFPEWDVDKIANKVGIASRSVSAETEFSSDMAVKAGEMLMHENNLTPDTFDMLILCTQSPDYFLPTTACMVQHRLKLPTSAGAIDINQGCSGYIYGLAFAQGLIAAGTCRNILFITAETYSKHIHPKDKGNRTVFGDAATATWISAEEGIAELGGVVLGSDGSGAENLIVRNGAMKAAKSGILIEEEKDIASSGDYLFMNGPEIFNFTLKAVPRLLESTLKKNNLPKEKVDWFVFHQANKYMLDHLRKKLDIPEEKFILYMENCGNTVSSTIPIVLKNSFESKTFKSGDQIVLSGFGVGYSWGGTVLTFNAY